MSSPEFAPVILPAPDYADVGRRLGAWLVDAAIQLCILFAVAFTLRFMHSIGLWSRNDAVEPSEQWRLMDFSSKLLMMIAYAVACGPFQQIFMEASSWQATIGKRLLRIYVADETLQRITLGRAAARWACMFVFGSILGLGSIASLFTVAFGEQRKALHDMAAGTLVVRGTPISNEGLEPARVLVAFAVPYLWLLATFYFTGA